MQYKVLLEKESMSDWGAYVPDLPSCAAAGKTQGEVSHSIQEAIEFQLEGVREDGATISRPSSRAIVVDSGMTEISCERAMRGQAKK